MGYPDGIAGEEIPLISRIIAVADAYNAMTSDRPYRDAMPSRVARMRLAQGVEGQFDTTIVAAFEAILAGATEEYRVAKRARIHKPDAVLRIGVGVTRTRWQWALLDRSFRGRIEHQGTARPVVQLVENGCTRLLCRPEAIRYGNLGPTFPWRNSA